MSVPQFLSVAYRYLKISSVTDVQTIINSLYTELIANGFTCTGGGSGLTPTTMLSPLRADRLRFSILLTRTSATQLTIAVYDDMGVLITTTSLVVQIEATGNDVYLCTGAYFCYIFSKKTSPVHFFGCGVLDNDPYSSLAEPFPAYFATGQVNLWESNYIWSIFSSAYAKVTADVQRFNNLNTDQAFLSMSGAYMFCPAELMDPGTSTIYGRMPQIVLCEDSIATETELIVPIDTGVTGTFIVACTGYGHGKVCIRKA